MVYLAFVGPVALKTPAVYISVFLTILLLVTFLPPLMVMLKDVIQWFFGLWVITAIYCKGIHSNLLTISRLPCRLLPGTFFIWVEMIFLLVYIVINHLLSLVSNPHSSELQIIEYLTAALLPEGGSAIP